MLRTKKDRPSVDSVHGMNCVCTPGWWLRGPWAGTGSGVSGELMRRKGDKCSCWERQDPGLVGLESHGEASEFYPNTEKEHRGLCSVKWQGVIYIFQRSLCREWQGQGQVWRVCRRQLRMEGKGAWKAGRSICGRSQDQNQSSSGGENVEAEAKNVSRANLEHLAQVTGSIVVLGSETGRTGRKAGFGRSWVTFWMCLFEKLVRCSSLTHWTGGEIYAGDSWVWGTDMKLVCELAGMGVDTKEKWTEDRDVN